MVKPDSKLVRKPLSTRSWAAMLLLTTTIVVVGSRPALASYQLTKNEGTIGTDIGGIWLAIHQVAPTFRVRVPLDEEKNLPFEVMPVPDELAPLVGVGVSAVAVGAATDERTMGKAGLFAGDLITRANSQDPTSVEELEAIAKRAEKDWIYVTVRRPSLAHTTGRVVKISYDAKVEEVDGTSAIAGENIRIAVIDGTLPFQDKLAATRRDETLYTPTAADVATAEKEWFRLPPTDPTLFIGAEHRVVALDHYDLGLRQDTSLTGTRFAIITTLKGNPITGGGTTIGIYGAREITSDEIVGSYVESTMANAPFPVSIDFNGSFVMKKIADFSHKDAEHRQAQHDKEMGADEESYDDVELEPDVP